MTGGHISSAAHTHTCTHTHVCRGHVNDMAPTHVGTHTTTRRCGKGTGGREGEINGKKHEEESDCFRHMWQESVRRMTGGLAGAAKVSS